MPETVGLLLTSVTRGLFDVPVSGVNENPDLLGSAAVDMVVGQLQRNEQGIPPFEKTLLIKGTWTGDFTVSRRPRATGTLEH